MEENRIEENKIELNEIKYNKIELIKWKRTISNRMEYAL